MRILDRKSGLEVEIVDGALVISIGVEALATAIAASPEVENYARGAEDAAEEDDPQVEVTDADVFAKEMLHQLLDESEDGTTPVHRMLDRAAIEAIEEGAEGVRLPGDDR